ncbi:hypothetical protein M427DRAFT_64294 [Gonapodya prolifera JEL478]|uniref:F-box domain-containing protein n=1 Tax=Gonapodya prolifera (strain JEL478) TaxID=1344416 RepID=A0A138ZYI1_GONPJ|nr:hypothetical protein M427DRAFT_64294 [Gonapodya prolifera JEL478]|eukprot:KXS09325.1 hypothetical protein M427DRAFT_64294 [Gonapodya prolifera JEL478]
MAESGLLPPEVWAQVVHKLRGARSTLAVLARASKLFNALAEPLIYTDLIPLDINEMNTYCEALQKASKARRPSKINLTGLGDDIQPSHLETLLERCEFDTLNELKLPFFLSYPFEALTEEENNDEREHPRLGLATLMLKMVERAKLL